MRLAQVFDGSNNSFSGPLPSAWGSAALLLHVNVSFNNLSGSLPAAWSPLSNLQTLDMSNNSLQVGRATSRHCSISTGTVSATMTPHSLSQ